MHQAAQLGQRAGIGLRDGLWLDHSKFHRLDPAIAERGGKVLEFAGKQVLVAPQPPAKRRRPGQGQASDEMRAGGGRTRSPQATPAAPGGT